MTKTFSFLLDIANIKNDPDNNFEAHMIKHFFNSTKHVPEFNKFDFYSGWRPNRDYNLVNVLQRAFPVKVMEFSMFGG